MIISIKKFFKDILGKDDTLKNWSKSGYPVPPPHEYKQKVIKHYKKFGPQILIETGTYYGHMVFALKDNFKKIYSIELSYDFYQMNVEKFKDYKHISIVHGDSGKILKSLMIEIKEPAIFWLDGHYSGGITAKGEKKCPIYEELDSVLESPEKLNHIFLIDDARLFIGEDDYPTIEELKEYFNKRNIIVDFKVEHDIIRVILNNQNNASKIA